MEASGDGQKALLGVPGDPPTPPRGGWGVGPPPEGGDPPRGGPGVGTPLGETLKNALDEPQ